MKGKYFMATALQKYAYHFKQKRAQEKILSDLRKEVLAELKVIEGGNTVVGDVEFHMTKKLSATIFPKDIQDVIDSLQQQIDDIKQNADEAGKVKRKYSAAFDASVPKSAEEEVLAAASNDYKKHFKL
jgi:phenylalanyl-tRNA synthetase alpha subunit